MLDPNAGQQQDPASAYSQLNHTQLSQVASEFVQRLRGQNDPRAQQLAQVDPNTATPGQVAEMHQYVAQNHPNILQDVLKHPVISGALGAFALHELRKHMGQQH